MYQRYAAMDFTNEAWSSAPPQRGGVFNILKNI
jgi:hypothetical protein